MGLSPLPAPWWFVPTGQVPFDSAGLEVLSSEECLAMLRRVQVGRVAVSVDACPAIFPVNFVLLDGAVVFRTGEGTKFGAAARNAVVAFEADEIDPTFSTGWSVLVVGTAEELLDPTQVEESTRIGLRPWAPGPRSHLVKISSTIVSGRRIDGTG
jgi:uncharacterized protein